jgi:hypothetical protein
MSPITEELLEEFFYRGTFARSGDRWRVVTEQGRVFEFDDNRFDLSQCLTPLVPGETEENREEMLYAACYFCQVVWGCVDVRRMSVIQRCRIAGYAGGYKFTVDENTFREFGISDAKAVFGESATVRNNWFPCGWRISVPDVGFVVLGLSGKELTVLKIEGNLYEDTLRFLETKQGHAVVRGKNAFCATWVVHGEMLGIRVIPEIRRGFLFTYLVSHVALLPVVGIGFVVANAFPGVKDWQLIAGGWLLLALIIGVLRGDDRKRGQALLNKFPQMPARHAKLDDARARGML